MRTRDIFHGTVRILKLLNDEKKSAARMAPPLGRHSRSTASSHNAIAKNLKQSRVALSCVQRGSQSLTFPAYACKFHLKNHTFFIFWITHCCIGLHYLAGHNSARCARHAQVNTGLSRLATFKQRQLTTKWRKPQLTSKQCGQGFDPRNRARHGRGITI